MSQEHKCLEVANAGEPPHLREFLIQRNGTVYLIKVTHPGYLQELKSRNASRPPEARADENVYPFEDMDAARFGRMDEEQVCQRLAQTPFEQLQPFLTTQITPD